MSEQQAHSASGLFPNLEGHWLSVPDADPRAVALYRRHYSAKNRHGQHSAGIGGPGERMILLTPDCAALWVWRRRPESLAVGHQNYDDGQRGVMCSVFRNEGALLSSVLVREACEIAWRRWGAVRLFTYVWDAKVRSINPGYCFKKAGWSVCGRNADGRLTLLEICPQERNEQAEQR